MGGGTEKNRMLRRVLVALDGSPHGDAAVSLGLEWARRSGAELLGLGVLDEPGITRSEAVPLGASEFKRHRDRVLVEAARRRVHGFLAEFRQRCAESGVRATVQEDIGRPFEEIVHEAHGADIVLLGRESHFDAHRPDDQTLGQVLHRCPRPVVVVPRESATGQGVLVAYGDGSEVARTLQTVVLLGLLDGELVEVVSADREAGRAEARLDRPGAFLSAHGIRHRLVPLTTADPPATVILDAIRRARPRLVVLGAHGRHPLRDLFGTSVTRAVIGASPVPVIAGA